MYEVVHAYLAGYIVILEIFPNSIENPHFFHNSVNVVVISMAQLQVKGYTKIGVGQFATLRESVGQFH